MSHFTLTADVKKQLYDLQAGECCECKGVMRGPDSWLKRVQKFERKNLHRKKKLTLRQPDNLATFEHVLPIRCGGNRALGNVLLSCRKCNLEKGAELPSAAAVHYLSLINHQLGLGKHSMVDGKVNSMFKWLIREGYFSHGKY